MKIVCAWCKEDMGKRGEGHEISHGICRTCKNVLMKSLQRSAAQTEWPSVTAYELATSRSPVSLYM